MKIWINSQSSQSLQTSQPYIIKEFRDSTKIPKISNCTNLLTVNFHSLNYLDDYIEDKDKEITLKQMNIFDQFILDDDFMSIVDNIKKFKIGYYQQPKNYSESYKDSARDQKLFSYNNIQILFTNLKYKYDDKFRQLLKYTQDPKEDKYFINNPDIDYNYPTTSYYQKVNTTSNKTEKICIIGDIHSSLASLCEILLILRDEKKYFQSDLSNNKKRNKLKDNHYIFFLGDLIDRGPYSIEILCIVFGLKYLNFDNIFIIKGNHESNKILHSYYGLDHEITKEYFFDKTFRMTDFL